MSTLPITAIFPTLNCREKLAEHIASSQDWLAHVSELIVVDSNSSDGSLQFLRRAFNGYKSKFVNTGPGLYAAWNLGVQLAKQPYIYFSTIGETISLTGLQQLLNWCESLDLDVVISTPQMIQKARCPINIMWPIHEMKGFLQQQGDIFVPNEGEKRLLSRAFTPECILGSSASNLYRRSALKRFPFPQDVGPQGDVMWACKYLFQLKVGISAMQCSTFLYDGDRVVSYRKYADIVTLFETQLAMENNDVLYLYNEVSRISLKQRRRLSNRLSKLVDTQNRMSVRNIIRSCCRVIKRKMTR